MNHKNMVLLISLFFVCPKVMKTAIESIQRRWVELNEPRDFASVFSFASSFDQKFINRIEDNLVELVETFSQEDRAKVCNRFLFLETCSSYDLIK